jgi:DHA1 family bicyclomycin/chloramphenicol resistance-like MFS transporter
MSKSVGKVNVQFTKGYYVFLMIFLGMLSAFGPFVTDMYLPTLPSMAEVFHTTASMVQLGLSTSMLGLALGQVFFGPLSDKYGRRRVLIAALLLFAVSTFASIYSQTIEFFVICRFIQGLGGSGAIVLSRSVASDCYSGRELAKTMAIIGAINGIAPVTAPVVGGMVSEMIGWQGIFWILLGIGLVLLVLCCGFKESLPRAKRHTGSVLSLLSNFPKLIKLSRFRWYVLMSAFANGVLFSYISSASFVIQDHYNFSTMGFALIFAVNSIAIGIGSALSLKLPSMQVAARLSGIGLLTIGVLQMLTYLMFDSFYIYEGLMFALLLFLGFALTSSTALAMDEGKMAGGAASAILGAMGFLFGGLVSPLVGIGNITYTTNIIIIVCALFTLFFAFLASKRAK